MTTETRDDWTPMIDPCATPSRESAPPPQSMASQLRVPLRKKGEKLKTPSKSTTSGAVSSSINALATTSPDSRPDIITAWGGKPPSISGVR